VRKCGRERRSEREEERERNREITREIDREKEREKENNREKERERERTRATERETCARDNTIERKGDGWEGGGDAGREGGGWGNLSRRSLFAPAYYSRN